LKTTRPDQDRPQRVVVVGAGHAGSVFVDLLLQRGFGGLVVMLGEEPTPPYQRPPLSKRLLKADFLRLLHDPTYYEGQGVELRTGVKVRGVDPQMQFVESSDGERIAYDWLVLAPGAEARRLTVPGHDLVGVHTLRSREDADRLAKALRRGGSLVIVGGGWIGLEVASSAREEGIKTTVVEREARLLARVASGPVAEFLARRHALAGVKILTGAEVRGFEMARDGRVGAVRLVDREIPADNVVVGVGARPRIELAISAGLGCQDGIVVDEGARTSAPNIFAIGDATVRPALGADQAVRLESIPGATEQAAQAVSSILGIELPALDVPWFWSDQLGLKIQIAGLPLPTDQRIVRHGDRPDQLTVLHTRGGRLVAVEAINVPPDFVAGRASIREGRKLGLETLADTSIPLQQAMADKGVVPESFAQGTPEMAELAAPEPRPTPGTVRVTCKLGEGQDQKVDLLPGTSLMEGLRRGNVPEIVAECGGTCSCATCHVLVADDWLARLGDPYPEEEELLDSIPGRRASSRLSCQIIVSETMDGLIVQIPTEA
jgi:3-phenylpropionate/trans-cinnamate dioxygenase ferredoxin reductase subunit